jgi:cytoskeletal protein RodZ
MSVGVLLRQARQSVGMSIEELSEITSVRRKVLIDLENDIFDSSGGLAYARGHIRIIAKALHANSDLLVEEFNMMNQDFNRPMIELLSENSVIPALHSESRVSFTLMAKAAAVIVALLIAIPTAASFIHSPKKVAHKAPISNSSTQSSGTTSTTGNGPAGSTAVATKTSPVAVVISANTGSTWLAVSDSSGAQLFSGMLARGTSRSFDDSQLINLTIGNAGAVDLNVNGKDSGTPGATGEVLHLQFGPGAPSQG